MVAVAALSCKAGTLKDLLIIIDNSGATVELYYEGICHVFTNWNINFQSSWFDICWNVNAKIGRWTALATKS